MLDWPRLHAFAARRTAAPLALVSLVGRSGSSYRPPGARLLVAADGAWAGSISGGCLEDELAREAVRVLATGASVLHAFDTRPHYGCPGRLELFIEALPDAWMDDLGARLSRRQPFVVHTRFAAGAGETTGSRLENAFAADAVPAGVFRQEVGPTPRLVVVSGTSDADAVLRFADVLGWDVHRVLPAGEPDRTDEAPGGEVCPAAALPARFPPDARTAVVVMTHHLARDLAYLRAVLPEPYPYIGLLGSRRRRETLLAALGEDGLLADETLAERLHAPVGLDLGADDPSAIALAIVAEIQAFWAGRPGGSLRARAGAIHPAGAFVSA
jgi:xanthine dehydrogenase accessory factor